jgi:hypothetical protein
MVYAKPFCIVYGTQTSDPIMAQQLFQTAIYLANANVAAHMTFVPLFSDNDYLALSNGQQNGMNVIFIGGAMLNKAMHVHSKQEQRSRDNMTPPVVFSKEGGFVVDDQIEFTDSSDDHTQGAAIIFTLPLQAGSLGVCIHAPVPSDYLHISRLMWPTVPPMVRMHHVKYYCKHYNILPIHQFASLVLCNV